MEALFDGRILMDDLHDGISMNESARTRAEAQCPGAYWIVGDIP